MLVCVDLSENDPSVVDYAALLALQFDAMQEVVLLHNIRFDFAGVSTTFSSDDIERLVRKIKKRLIDQYREKFETHAIGFEVVVTDNNSTAKAILVEAEQRDSDVVLMGKKASNQGLGIIPQKVLATDQRQVPLLLVPSGAAYSLKEVVAGVDLSNATRKIVQTMRMFQEETLSGVTFFHVYKVPINYFPYLETSREELHETLKRRAAKRMEQFQAELNDKNADNLPMVIRHSTNVSPAVLNFVEEQKADLLVIGRLGKTSLFGNNIGGVARTLLGTDVTIPICIV